MNKVRNIKDKLYQLMLTACDSTPENGDTKISQKLGIAMTNAVTKGGVVNVITQNISFQKILPKIVEIAQEVDQLEYEMLPPTIEIKQIENLHDPIEKCCKFFYEQGTTWADFRNVLRREYMKYVRNQFRTNTETAEFLDVHVSYITKNIKEPENENS